jgi:O-glycosyl hydrolase
VQFDSDRPLPGLETTVRILSEVVATPWTTASWLTTEGPTHGRPIDRLRDGDTAAVLAAARQLAATLLR